MALSPEDEWAIAFRHALLELRERRVGRDRGLEGGLQLLLLLLRCDLLLLREAGALFRGAAAGQRHEDRQGEEN
jgi:hypothetical protein